MPKSLTLFLVFVCGLIVGALVAFSVGVIAIDSGEGSEIVYKNASSEIIVVESPGGGEEVISPLVIRGRARGTWYFEATAPVELLDVVGTTIATGYVTSQSNWMTEEFVSFEGTLTFESPGAGTTGTLILRNDNPSGLSENDRSVEIPITFSE